MRLIRIHKSHVAIIYSRGVKATDPQLCVASQVNLCGLLLQPTCRNLSLNIVQRLLLRYVDYPFSQRVNTIQLIEEIVRQLPQEAMQVLRAYPEELNGRLPREHTNVLNNFFEEISHTPV